MIKKLKIKFVLVNMLLISIVLVTTFIALGVSTYRRLYDESLNTMHWVLSQDENSGAPKREFGGARPDKAPPVPSVTTFYVKLDASYTISKVISNNTIVSDANALNKIVEQCLDTNEMTGIVPAEDLRFLKQKTPDGMKIAFVDRTNEISSMAALVKTSLLVGLGSLLAFFAVSLFLANWALKPIKVSWEKQTQFVADASHELKTPLTVILANAGIILSHKQDTVENQSKWVEYIKTEAERMTGLVNSLLFLAKADDAKTKTVLSNINFSDTVWSCLLPFESVAFEQEKTLYSHIAPNVSVIGDEGKLKQLIIILLDNACKYAGEKGTITIELTESQEKVKLAVTNTGEPILPEHVEHIFERFYRVDESRSRENGGYGLGLAIAKSITQRHKGKITAQSTPSCGTTFTVTLAAAKNKI